MAVVKGMQASFSHPENGMILSDMRATLQVANKYREVIIFRSTGPWSKRWIERGYPTKNFHVKGKSSDWGPHAGLVSYDGRYSKVGADSGKATKGTKANDDGLKSGFASKQTLVLSIQQIDDQCNRAEENPPRKAVQTRFNIANSGDMILIAERSGDKKKFAFRAAKRPDGLYNIFVYPEDAGTNTFKLIDAPTEGPLEVMTSGETGADKPMTGDYDLLSICPSWADYGSRVAAPIVKEGIHLNQGGLQKGLSYQPGMGMDNVLDPRLHTAGSKQWHDYQHRKAMYRKKIREGRSGPMSPDSLKLIFGKETPWMEHGDMGNLTPRILRAINALNAAMGATGSKGAFRRVHHNAESHRNRMFGALTKEDMEGGDGFPFTMFQPDNLSRTGPTAAYGDVCTLETFPEFKAYAQALKDAGYVVPKNWVWGI